MSSRSEKESIAGCASGEQKDCWKLYDSYKNYVAAIVRNMVGECEDVKDLTQQVFLQSFGAIDKFRGESSFKTWLARITRNLCLNYLAQKRRRHEDCNISIDEIDEDGNPVHELKDDSFNPAGMLEQKELRAVIMAAMELLTKSHREALSLSMAGLSYDEIAKIAHANKKTVGTRIYYAKKQLSKMLVTYIKAIKTKNIKAKK